MLDNANTNEDEYDFYPVKGNSNVVRLPIVVTNIKEYKSITFDRSKSSFTIANQMTSGNGRISEITTLFLDGNSFYINMTYEDICKVLFR